MCKLVNRVVINIYDLYLQSWTSFTKHTKATSNCRTPCVKFIQNTQIKTCPQNKWHIKKLCAIIYRINPPLTKTMFYAKHSKSHAVWNHIKATMSSDIAWKQTFKTLIDKMSSNKSWSYFVTKHFGFLTRSLADFEFISDYDDDKVFTRSDWIPEQQPLFGKQSYLINVERHFMNETWAICLGHFPTMEQILSVTVTWFNNKQPQFVSPVLNSKATLMLGSRWHLCQNPLVSVDSAESESFTNITHKNLENHDVHGWLLEPLSSRNKILEFLKGTQPGEWLNQAKGVILGNPLIPTESVKN